MATLQKTQIIITNQSFTRNNMATILMLSSIPDPVSMGLVFGLLPGGEGVLNSLSYAKYNVTYADPNE